jgi:glycosyltransferase involved in cell wall biosynthesis/GT2 family glycosyltransferase
LNDFDHDLNTLGALTSPDLAPLFWPPSRMGVASAWYGHVPFAHWLVTNHKPRRLVELGTHTGVSYAAFCEAVLRQGLDTACTAIDTWQGDAHAGAYDETIYTELRRFHDARYGAFSDLRRARFDAALGTIAPGSVDLLHIDGRHFYEDVREDFETWRDRLSSRAVVLFHDTNEHAHDFGVWRLWAELRERFPAFEFLHGHGLGVLAIGPEVTGAVAALCATSDAGTISAVRERFAALGERWIAAYDMLAQQQDAAQLATDLAATRQWAETAQADINRLFPQHVAMTERTRALRLRLAEALHDLAATRRAVCDREANAAAGVDWAGYAARLHELAQAQIDALHAERLTLLASTSWRLTAPLRRAATTARGEQPALPARPLLPPLPRQAAVLPAPQAVPARLAASRRVLFVSGEDHTPGHVYRVERAAAAARALGFEAACKAAAPVGPDDLDGVGVVVLWRVPFSEHVRGIIDMTREQGGTVVFDVDDLMFRPEMAVIDIIDGIRSQRFSELQTQAFFTQIGRTLKACDVVTCPTEELAHHARLMGRPAYVIPNSFDEAGHALARRARREWRDVADDLLRIGYAGGSRTHQRDFAVAAPAIARVLRETPQARLVIFRDPSSGEGLVLMHEFDVFADLLDRIEWRDMVKLEALPTELARFDINIAPLEADNPFCAAKSELKVWEAALAGVPTIASPAGPFRRAIEHGVTGFLAETGEEWYAALARLAADAALRQRVAQSAYHVALGRFGPATRARAFAQMLAQAQGGAAGAAAFERDRYRATLPATIAPVVPEAETILSLDGRGTAAVTVIVPVFNYSDVVPEALQSVAAQTLAALDLVVIDDASPDDSLAMVQAWVQAHGGRFNRVVVLRHRENAGLGFARNSGFAAAETPFVLPLDADNRLRPAACQTLLAAMAASDAAFAYPAIQQFGTKSEIFGRDPYSVLRLQGGNYIDAMALVRKSAWAEAGGYDHVQYGWEDYDFWCRLAERGHFGQLVPEVLADYRVHAQSMLHTMTEVQDHKNDLVADLKRRHPWLDVPRKEEHGS